MDFICPAPLAYAYSEQDTTIWALKIGNCAVPCPSIQITEDEFQLQADVFTYMVLLTSLITILMLFKMAKRFFVRTMFVVGFFVFAVVALVFVYQNRNNDVVCSGPGHYVKRDSLCVFQAAVFVFSIVWVQAWSVILAVDAYLHIVNRLTPQHTNWRRKVYFCLGFGFSLGCTIIPLSAGNLGFDPYANIPFCLYLFSDEKAYFWATLFVPFCLLNITCSLITIAGAIKIQKVFVLSKTPATDAEGDDGDDVSRSSSHEGRFISGHGDDVGSSFGGSTASAARYKEDILSAMHACPHRGKAPEAEADVSVASERPGSAIGSAISATELQMPLLDQSVFYSDSDSELDSELRGGRESIGEYAYARRNAKSADPECLTNVTDDYHTGLPIPIFDSGGGGGGGGRNDSCIPHPISGDIAMGQGSLGPAPPPPASPGPGLGPRGRGQGSSTGSAQPLNWFRMWSTSADISEETGRTIHGKKISHWEYLVRKTVKYNGRTMLFLVMFCMTTLVIAPVLIYLQYFKYDIYVNSGDDFVECLVKASIECPTQTQGGVDACGEAACGSHPGKRPNVIEVRHLIYCSIA
jgi:hypothetical protein